MTEIEQFVADMAETINMIEATDRQREVYKASLKYAISHAALKAAQRKKQDDGKTQGSIASDVATGI